MGWAYLVVSINGAAYTLNAYRPARKSRVLYGWSFFASWITIEMAPFHLLWQIVATAVFAWKGALRTNPGRLGLAITLASWAGLALSVRRSFAARHEIREALRELRHEAPEVEPQAVKVERNITFARAGGRNLHLDVHSPAQPAAPDERRPALVQIHGGGWVLGFKDRQGQLLMDHLAARGWVCFNVDYRLSPMATFPDHLIDVNRAIAWIRDHADDYGIDPDFIAVTGGSAGGHLTTLTALTHDEDRYQPGFEEADTSVQAAVPFYGVYDFTNRNGAWPEETIPWFLAPVVMKVDPDEDPEAWAAASPLDQVRAEAPPFLVVHGDIDVLAPVEDARGLRATSARRVRRARVLPRAQGSAARLRDVPLRARQRGGRSGSTVPERGARRPCPSSRRRPPVGGRRAGRRGGARRRDHAVAQLISPWPGALNPQPTAS